MATAQTMHRIKTTPLTTKLVIIGILTDLFIALMKFTAAYISSSSSMVSEGVHSLIDVSTGLILIYGLANSRKGPSIDHQLGYGREVYFWNFAAAILIFSLGAGAALLDGLHQIAHPVQLENVRVNFAVLALSAIVEIAAFTFTIRSIDLKRGKQGFFRYLKLRRDPTSLTIVFGGVASILGLFITATATALTITQANPVYDGAGSIAIALILAVAAIKLAADSKTLLIGVPADPSVASAIIAEVAANSCVLAVNGATTVHLAPEQLLVALSIWFKEEMTTGELEDAVVSIEMKLRHARPEIVALFITPERPKRYREQEAYATPAGLPKSKALEA